MLHFDFFKAEEYQISGVFRDEIAVKKELNCLTGAGRQNTQKYLRHSFKIYLDYYLFLELALN